MDKPASKQEADDLLLWGCKQNPGSWVGHSRVVARAAETIALRCGMDGNIAYSLGLLHDIGRYEGITGLQHIYAGYNLMNEKSYRYNARICLTHSFPNKDLKSFNGNNDCLKEEIKQIQSELKRYEYDDYDRLIQLCDSISLTEGICVLEIRLVDVARRCGMLNKSILHKWNAYFELKSYFDKKSGINIYELFFDEITKTFMEEKWKQ